MDFKNSIEISMPISEIFQDFFIQYDNVKAGLEKLEMEIFEPHFLSKG